MAQKRAQEAAYEQQKFTQFREEYKKAVGQITIKTPSGIKTRVDAIGLDGNGNLVINEFKSSSTAPLTVNQKTAFPEIFNEGGVVVGAGKGIFTDGYEIEGGTNITIIRP